MPEINLGAPGEHTCPFTANSAEAGRTTQLDDETGISTTFSASTS